MLIIIVRFYSPLYFDLMSEYTLHTVIISHDPFALFVHEDRLLRFNENL